MQLGGRLGLTNSLHVGIVVVDGGFALGTMSPGAKIEGFSGSLLANHYRGHLPLALSWRVDTGSDLSTLFECSVGPTYVYWQNYALIDPTTLDADGLPVSVPVGLEDAWYLGGTGSLSALFEWRIGNHFVLAAGPTASVSYLGGVTASAGMMLCPSLVFGHPFF